jgi:tetratricopeptide (TPR) repeat protein
LNEGLAQAYYLKGNIYRESGDTSRAISSLQTAVEQDNKMTLAFQDLGVIYAARKNPIALDYYANALRIDPSNAEVKYARAKLLQDLGKSDEAIAEYEKILNADKSCFTCLYNLGAIYFGIKGDFKKAVAYFTQAIETNPSYTEAYFARGVSYARLKDNASARADYEMCLKLQPNYPPAVQGLNEL